MEKQKSNFFEIVQKKTEGFIYSLLFPALLCFITLFFWVADLQVVGLILICLTGSFVFIFYENLAPAIPALLLLGMTYRDPQSFSSSTITVVFVIILGASVLFNLVKYPIRKIKLDLLSIALLVFTACLALGGLFSPFLGYFFHAIPILSTAGVCAFVIHLFITNRVKEQKHYDNRTYVCYSFLFVINVACMQLIYAFLHEYFIDKKTFSVPGSFCWANTNHIASLILIAVPVCCYLISRAKNIFPLLIQLVFLYVACFVSQSDGGLATLLIFTPFLIYKTQVSVLQKNREAFKLFWISIIFICAIVALAFFTFNYSDSIAFVDKMTSDSGRAPIYDKAWNLFTQYPIFGIGLGYSAFSALSEYSGFFHSTFFQTIASAGIIGFISCVFLYFARIRSLTKNASELCSFFLVSFIMHACYALIDNGEFNIVLMYFTAMFSFVLTQTKRAEMDRSLPVCKIFKSLS